MAEGNPGKGILEMHQGETVRGHWQGQAQIRDPNKKADSAADLRGATVGSDIEY